MKNIILSTLLLLAIISVSCEDFLNEKPTYQIDSGVAFSTPEGAELVYNGALYNLSTSFWSYQGYHQTIGLASATVYRTGGTWMNDMNNLNYADNQAFIGRIWSNMYKNIAELNTLAKYIEDNEGLLEESPEYGHILGKVYFLRAYLYFRIVRLWGDVPLKIEPTVGVEHKPLSTKDQVYDQIIIDFKEAIKYLPEGDGTPSSYVEPIQPAAHAFLAKVYATRASSLGQNEYWEEAKNHADIVINSGEYALVEDLSSLHSPQGRNSIESIFEIQSNFEIPNSLTQGYTPANYTAAGWAGYIRYNPWMYKQNIIEPGYADYDSDKTEANTITKIRDRDPRIDITYIDSSFVNVWGTKVQVYPEARWANGAYVYTKKYVDPAQESWYSNQQWIVLRYADILLLRAEIENELSGPQQAFQYVNQVLERARKNGKGTYPLDWNSKLVPDQNEFRRKIYWERMFELLGEGQEFFEERARGHAFFVENVVKKHNNFKDPLLNPIRRTKNTDESIMYLPIPVTESANNNEID